MLKNTRRLFEKGDDKNNRINNINYNYDNCKYLPVTKMIAFFSSYSSTCNQLIKKERKKKKFNQTKSAG